MEEKDSSSEDSSSSYSSDSDVSGSDKTDSPSISVIEEAVNDVPEKEEKVKKGNLKNVDLTPNWDEHFALNRDQLNFLLRRQNLKKFTKNGGADTVCKALRTDAEDGISATSDDIQARQKAFGVNSIKPPKRKNFLQHYLAVLNDLTLIILMIAGTISLILGLAAEDDPSTGWIEGTAILLGVAIVSFVGAFNNWRKDKQFDSLNAIKNEKEVKLRRNGEITTISISKLLVGDCIVLNSGDQVPADGICIESDKLEIDESVMTGESDTVKKNPLTVPFMLSGCLVAEGNGKMIVTNVGMDSEWGRTMHELGRKDPAPTPLQRKLDKMAILIGKIGMTAAVLTYVALSIMWIIEINDEGTTPKGFEWSRVKDFLDFFIIGVTILVVAVPEGLPLAVTLSLAYSMRKMLQDQNLVRHLEACETMGGATNICSDKTGTLTLNQMTVVEGYFAGRSFTRDDPSSEVIPSGEDLPQSYVDLFNEGVALNTTAFWQIEDPQKEAKEEEARWVEECNIARSKGLKPPKKPKKNKYQKKEDKMAKKINKLRGIKEGQVREVLKGSKTEGALLKLAGQWGCNVEGIRSVIRPKKVYPFSSTSKRMSTLIELDDGSPSQQVNEEELNEEEKVAYGDGEPESAKPTVATSSSSSGNLRLYVKGASEIVLALCTRQINSSGSVSPLTDERRDNLNALIQSMARKMLRTLVVAYVDFPASSFVEAPEDSDEPDIIPDESNMVLVSLVGIQDPLRIEVKYAVQRCKHAGIKVRMVTGDNVLTATSIAKECGIIVDDEDLVIEGPNFREMNNAQQDDLLPKLAVMARSSPTDKLTLVQRLRNAGEVVAVTGDGTNDAPALSEADIGLSMGLSGTEVAKEASDVVIMDDNFESIVKAVVWGRSVYDNIRKFVQFQLTVNVVALIIAFVGAVTGKGTPLTAVQLLWVNLIMDSMGALALGTEPPTEALLDRPPYGRHESLISITMWRNIFGQAFYQLIVLFTILYGGCSIFNLDGDGKCGDDTDHGEPSVHYTFLFNTFVIMQVFNEINSRKCAPGEINVFKGIFKNKMFVGIIIITIVVQAMIVELAGSFAAVTGISWWMWLMSFGFGLLTLPWGLVLRFIPAQWIWERTFQPKQKKDISVQTEISYLLEEKQEEEAMLLEEEEADRVLEDQMDHEVFDEIIDDALPQPTTLLANDDNHVSRSSSDLSSSISSNNEDEKKSPLS